MHCIYILYCITEEYIFRNSNSVNCTETETVKIDALGGCVWHAGIPRYNRQPLHEWVPGAVPRRFPHPMAPLTWAGLLWVYDLYCTPSDKAPSGYCINSTSESWWYPSGSMPYLCPSSRAELACTLPGYGIIVRSESLGGATVGMLRCHYRLIIPIVLSDAIMMHKINKHRAIRRI